MLTSLFGDLDPSDPDGKKRRERMAADSSADPALTDALQPADVDLPFDDSAPDSGFAATAILETTRSEFNDRGLKVDRHQSDLVVTGSAAFAIRDHFTRTRADMEFAARMITLVDPAAVWAGAVIKALSDATGRPIERIHLREQNTLKSLAVVERTVLLRRQAETLKIYHADVRAPGRDNAEVPMALIERSHMTAVIVGPMSPTAVDDLLASLSNATRGHTWACPNLLFMLPPEALWIANKVKAIVWPRNTRVICIDEPLISATAVWNALLGVWNRVKHDAVLPPQTPASLLGMGDFPIKVADLPGTPSDTTYGTTELGRLGDSGFGGLDPLGAPPTAPAPMGSPTAQTSTTLPPGATLAGARSGPLAIAADRAQECLQPLLSIEGLLACAVVDLRTGYVVAQELRPSEGRLINLQAAAGSAAQAFRTQRQMARQLGVADRVEESHLNAGNRQVVMRSVSKHPDAFLLALLDKTRGNVALVRYKLLEAERGLA
jgi:hypothetical protein